jgi:hypothetical protein
MLFASKEVALLTWKRCATFLIILAIGALAPVCVAGQEVTTSIERKSVPEQADRDARPFLTREGRLRAKPLDWRTTIGKPGPRRNLRVDQGKAATSKGGEPNPNAIREGQKLYPEEWRYLNQGPRPTTLNYMYDDAPLMFIKVGTADVFTQYCEGCAVPTTTYPDAAIGKLFSSSGSCSASVISGNNAIVTAAHCCYDRGKKNWVGGWVFAPAYDNGAAPFGTFNWSSATILTSWITSGDIPSDVCVIRLANDSAGRGVTFYTGWLGRSWNFGSVQEHHALGYPGNLGGGNLLELCTSESFSPSSACGGGNVLNTGCSMTFGSSGGPWIRSYRGGNWVNSVVHGYDGTTCTGTFGQTFNGARFTSGNIFTICNAAGC